MASRVVIQSSDQMRSSPVVILVGGKMTVDDGSEIDSRQLIDGDPMSIIVHKSLTTSWLWWNTVISAVNPILDSELVDDPFALLVGNRSVVELLADGTLRRRRINTLLPGRTSVVEVICTDGAPLPEGFSPGASLGEWREKRNDFVGYKVGETGKRWRFLDGNPYHMNLIGNGIGMSVLVDTSDSGTNLTAKNEDEDILSSHRFAYLEDNLLCGQNVVLVVPHTHRSERTFRRYASGWHREDGRVATRLLQLHLPTIRQLRRIRRSTPARCQLRLTLGSPGWSKTASGATLQT